MTGPRRALGHVGIYNPMITVLSYTTHVGERGHLQGTELCINLSIFFSPFCISSFAVIYYFFLIEKKQTPLLV